MAQVAPPKPDVIAFVAELVVRLFGKTPYFFKVVRVVSLAVALISGIPALLETAGVVLPAAIAIIASKVIAVSGLVGMFVASLPLAEPEKEALPLTDKKTDEAEPKT